MCACALFKVEEEGTHTNRFYIHDAKKTRAAVGINSTTDGEACSYMLRLYKETCATATG